MTMLEVTKARRVFGGLVAVRDVSFEVFKGDILGLIGPNGAGKTTLFNLVSGVLKPTSGSIRFNGREISKAPSNRIVKLGLARTFQAATLYPEATVLRNVVRGAYASSNFGIGNALFPDEWRRRVGEECRELLRLFALSAKEGMLAKELPYGEQRRLGVAIALASRPQLLMLDEPVAGLNPEEAAAFSRTLQKIRAEQGVTMVLVEHHMRTVMELCNRIVVLDHGQKIAEGNPKEISTNQAVIEAYLGRSAQHA